MHMKLLTGNRQSKTTATTLATASKKREKWVADYGIEDFEMIMRSRSLLVTKLVSTVTLTKLTKAWLLSLPSLTHIFLNYKIGVRTISFPCSCMELSKRAYMIKHSACDKHVR